MKKGKITIGGSFGGYPIEVPFKEAGEVPTDVLEKLSKQTPPEERIITLQMPKNRYFVFGGDIYSGGVGGWHDIQRSFVDKEGAISLAEKLNLQDFWVHVVDIWTEEIIYINH